MFKFFIGLFVALILSTFAHENFSNSSHFKNFKTIQFWEDDDGHKIVEIDNHIYEIGSLIHMENCQCHQPWWLYD